jgi:prepilin-type N-terminal cleavage/methylation domain-containing protein
MTGPTRFRMTGESGFSLIEVIIVVALIAFVYTVAIPQFSMRSGAETANKLNQLASDVRSAFDQSVLTRKTYRLVFELASGNYWLEEASTEHVFLGSDKADRDLTENEEKDAQLAFDAKLQEYTDLAGQAVTDPESDKEIPAVSPVLQAKNLLKKPKWTRVENMEWSMRSLAPVLIIQDMQSEHHAGKQSFQELGQEARAMIYFFPNGYVQKAVLHIAYRKGDTDIDDTQEPYTVITSPNEGTADIVAGYVEVNVHDDRAG